MHQGPPVEPPPELPGCGEEGEVLQRAAFGASWERLQAIKREYDPDNMLRFNQDISPA